MTSIARRTASFLAAVASVLAGLVVCVSAGAGTGGRIACPVVFTSRKGPAGFASVLPAADSKFPGTMVARAIPGKLMLLGRNLEVTDLTWGKRLPDGSTLIDVMSPSVSMDGKKVIFAAIKKANDHFRLYEVGTDGTGLRQLTGLTGDRGCVENPYLRFAADGKHLSDSDRRRIDFDDLDPTYLPDGRILFASSRLPRLSLYGNHRVTNLWVMNADGSDLHQITFNLASERFPYVLKDGRILFSFWSRTLTRAAADRLITGCDEAELKGKADQVHLPIVSGELPNNWWPASVNPDGTDFRALAKPAISAIHARPLFNGYLVFATQAESSMTRGPFRTALGQVAPGLISRASGGRLGSLADFPRPADSTTPGPGTQAVEADILARDAYNLAPWAVSPSALPPHQVLFSFTKSGVCRGGQSASGYDYGLYTASDDWAGALSGLAKQSASGKPSFTPQFEVAFERSIGLTKLLDLPGTCEGEAQAVYARTCLVRKDQKRNQSGEITFSSGRVYKGPVGGVSSPSIYLNPVSKSPGQNTDTGEGPVFVPPPAGLIKSIEFYALSLEKDESGQTTARASLESVGQAEVSAEGGFHITVPAGVPLMQFGKDSHGKLATWSGKARDSRGKSAQLAAFAGDHFGYATEGVPRSFCVGCHAGHTVIPGFSIADQIASTARK